MASKVKINVENRKPLKWRGDLEETLGYDQMAWRKQMAAATAFLTASDKSVMDLGAGNMQLSKFLPEGCVYYPVDYRKTSPKTIVCDFNHHEFPKIHTDVICVLGTLEYIGDPEWFLTSITESCHKCILSYMGRETFDSAMLYTDEIIRFMESLGWYITARNTSLAECTLVATFEKKSPKMICRVPDCTGCGCCMNVCPADAITMEYDAAGYLRPVLREEKCLDCHRCVDACPALKRDNAGTNIANPKCYAFHAEKEIRMQSSSGGFFTVLSTYILENGGYVYGAVWDANFDCKIVEGSSMEDLAAMRCSKYVQSDTGYIYRLVAKRLTEGKTAAYFGCPCQVAGLKSYLKNVRPGMESADTLLTVDLACFCTPSIKLFQRYLDEEFGIENVRSVNFRDKFSGKGTPLYKIELKDGTILLPETDKDPYQRAFHGVIARNDVCDRCEYYQFPRPGDLTIGDYTQIELHDPSWNDGMGTGAVFANNEKAERILKQLESGIGRMEETPAWWLTETGNRIGTEARPAHKNRDYFHDLIQKKTIREAAEMALSSKYDIGLVGMHNLNTGNNLTNYALYRVLSDMGYSVLMIGNPIDVTLESYINGTDRFKRFLCDPYHRWTVYPAQEESWEYYPLNDQCDMFLVGSDQIWRNDLIDGLNRFASLDWVRNDKYKISYATSFGTSEFQKTKNDFQRQAYFLSRFSHISVREESGARIVREMTGQYAEVVLDPVFLCDQAVFDEMAARGNMRMPDRAYVGAYLLDLNRQKSEVLLHIASQKTEGEYRVITDYPDLGQGDRALTVMTEPAIEEWLAMVKGCKFFVTDSFHGICFAIIFQKDFCVVTDRDNWRGYTRLEHILKLFHLESRMFAAGGDVDIEEILQNPIQWDMVLNLLENRRTESLQYLKDALAGVQDFQGKYNEADMLQEKEYAVKHVLKQQQVELSRIRNGAFLERDGRKMKTVVCFGTGKCFKENLRRIQRVYALKYVCDNDPDKWGQTVAEGIVCISPEQLAQMQDVLVVITVYDIARSFEIARGLVDRKLYHFTHYTNWLKEIEDTEIHRI